MQAYGNGGKYISNGNFGCLNLLLLFEDPININQLNYN